jgi:hypothetical protein
MEFASHVWLFKGAEGGKWLQQLKSNEMKDEDGSSDSGDDTYSDLGSKRTAKKPRTH